MNIQILKVMMILLISLSSITTAQNFILTKSFTGSWYDPLNSGQGFLIEIIKNENQKKVLATWYTFDTEGNQMWLIGVGNIQGQQISLEMLLPQGGGFGSAHNSNNVISTAWGNVVISFSDCNTAVVNWDANLVGYENGSMPLTRLTKINNLNCTGGLSDELGDSAENFELVTNLNNTGLIPQASGEAKYEERPDRVEFSVEVEDLPIGIYNLLVEGENKGNINVVSLSNGAIKGEIEFRDPVEFGKFLLDFETLGKLIEVTQGTEVFLSSTIDNNGNNGNGTTNPNAPPFGNSEIEVALNNLGVYPIGKAEIELEQREDRVDFKVELEDIPIGFYQLRIAGNVEGNIEVIQNLLGQNEGELEFRNPVEPGKSILDFNPIDQLVEVLEGDVVLFSLVFTEDNGAPCSTPDCQANQLLDLEVELISSGLDADANGRIKYETRTDRKDLNVEIEDLPDGVYQLFIDGVSEASITVVNSEGEVEFRDPEEAGKLPLGFDPLNKLFEIKQGNQLYLSAILN